MSEATDDDRLAMVIKRAWKEWVHVSSLGASPMAVNRRTGAQQLLRGDHSQYEQFDLICAKNVIDALRRLGALKEGGEP